MSKYLAIELTSLMNEVEALEEQNRYVSDDYLDRISGLVSYLTQHAPELLDPRLTPKCQ
jgi:hypothetical protein